MSKFTKENAKKTISDYEELVDYASTRCFQLAYVNSPHSMNYVSTSIEYFQDEKFITELVNSYDNTSREGHISITWEELELSDEEFKKYLDNKKEEYKLLLVKKEQQDKDKNIAFKKAQLEKLKKELGEI